MALPSLSPESAKVRWTARELAVLRSLTITASFMSMCACTMMLYWFFSLRRKSFRLQHVHYTLNANARLIMALVLCDCIRAFWEFAYPIVIWAHHDRIDQAAYCQATGFFIAAFMEAGDYAVVVIAIHTALYVFSPNITRPGDEGGLSRYRVWVFALWAVFSILMASLAFLSPTKGYVPLSVWCYLPSRPLTWRMSLSWGPRYFVFAFITVLYIAIYVYIRRKFKHIAKGLESSSVSSTDSFLSDEDPSASPMKSLSKKSNRVLFAKDTNPNHTVHVPYPEFQDNGLENPQALAVATSENSKQITFQQRKQMVSRQLRLLFVYPVVYIIIWIVPFAHHISQYDHDTFRDPIFGLACGAAFLIPLQGFINVSIYARNEKPWRISPDGRRPSDTSLSPHKSQPVFYCSSKGKINNFFSKLFRKRKFENGTNARQDTLIQKDLEREECTGLSDLL